MTDNSLKGFRVAILATNGFEQVELEEPRKALDRAGAETVVISPAGGKIQGMNHDEKGDKVAVNLAVADAKPEEFEAVLLPGGVVNADKLRMDQNARKFMQSIDQSGKPIAVICHGAWLLVSSGLVKGRHLTSYFTLQDDIRNAGGNWTDEEAVVDNNWISSRMPDDIPAFNKGMLQLFAQAGAKSKAASRL